MTESTALTTTTSNNQALAFLHDGAALDHRYRLAKAFSMSGMVPITDRCECSSLDLSAGAAWRLGIPLDGIATVSIRY